MKSFAHLARPPINEVICGFIFSPTTLTALDFGVYWDRRRADFPRHELHPPVFDDTTIQLGPVVDARAWLVSVDEDLLVQLQNDRFYMNWRRRGEGYPRFSDHDGQPGLKQRAISEFRKFESFASERTSQPLGLVRLELGKIDVLKKGSEYDSTVDLRELLPVTSVFEQISLAEPQQLQLRMAEGNGQARTHIAVVMDSNRVRIETRYTFPFTGELDDDFIRANERVNQVFFGLLNTERFG
ncbi:MAG: TIGR04255 family protein [Chromatiaceae bacterium]